MLLYEQNNVPVVLPSFAVVCYLCLLNINNGAKNIRNHQCYVALIE